MYDNRVIPDSLSVMNGFDSLTILTSGKAVLNRRHVKWMTLDLLLL